MNQTFKFGMMTLALFSVACSSGGDGDSGGIVGQVTDRSGVAQSGVLVRWIVVDDEGVEQSELDQTITDANGGFTFETDGEIGSSMIVRAELPDGALEGFTLGSALDAVSHGMVQAVLEVTAPPGGRSLTDFTPEEVKTIIDTVREVIPSSLDTADSAAVLEAVIAAAGRTIPEGAGGVLSAESSASFDPTDSTETAPDLDSSVGCGRPATFITGLQFEFDLTEAGALCNVNGVTSPLSDAFDVGFELSLAGDTFTGSLGPFFPGDSNPGVPTRTIEDLREFVYGPEATDGGLQVTRKVYIPEGGDVIRYLDIFENPSSSDLSVSLQLSGDFGLGSILNPPLIYLDSSGDQVADQDDDWAALIASDPSTKTPTVAMAWNGPSAIDRADVVFFPPDNGTSFLLRWDSVTIPAAGKKSFATFARILPGKVADTVTSAAELLYEVPDLTGMNSGELSSLQNFRSSRGNIVGEAGSVVSGSTVTAVNGTSGVSVSTTAGRDGGFAIVLSVVAGDRVTVTSSDDYAEDFTIP